MSNLKDYDFIVGFTLFTGRGFKTMYRHFDKLETAKMFASNVNIKNNCKIYVDLDYHKDEIKNLINENNDLHKEINRRIKLKIVVNEFISKNKIREKIKRLDYNSDNTEQRYFKKEVLQELLNENHIPHID